MVFRAFRVQAHLRTRLQGIPDPVKDPIHGTPEMTPLQWGNSGKVGRVHFLDPLGVSDVEFKFRVMYTWGSNGLPIGI